MGISDNNPEFTSEGQFGMGEGQHAVLDEQEVMEDGSQGMEGEGEVKVDQHSKGEGGKVKNAKQIVLCPMCNGKGYYEEIGKPEITGYNRNEGHSEAKSCILPSITQSQQPYQLEQLFRNPDNKVLSRVSDPAVPMSISKPQTRLPPVHIPNSCGGKMHHSAGQVKSTPNNMSMGNFPHLVNLLPAPAKFDKHPEDVARLAAIKLNRSEWDIKKAGLEECLQLAHSYPEELEPHMSVVYRAMSSLLNNFRPQVTLFVCQAAREFFAHMRSTCRPEYDELIYTLLSRTADTNKYIRLYANDALDKMVTYIPTAHAVRPLVEKGPKHNNPLVRTATARLLTCIVALRTPNTILTNPHLRETCKRIIETATLLIADSNLDTRAAAKKLFSRFMSEEEFESIYYAEVDEKLRKRIQRTYVELKAKIQAQM